MCDRCAMELGWGPTLALATTSTRAFRVGKAGFEPATSTSRTPPRRCLAALGSQERQVSRVQQRSVNVRERQRMCAECAMSPNDRVVVVTGAAEEQRPRRN